MVMGHQRRRKDLYILEGEDTIKDYVKDKITELGLIIDNEEGKYVYTHDSSGYKYRIVKYNFKRKPQIPHLYFYNPYAYHNLQTYLKLEKPYIKLVSKEYKTCKDEILYICEKHEELGIQSTTLTCINQSADFCYGCVNEKRGLRYRISDEKILKRCNKLNIEYVGRYNDDNKQETVVKYICPRHRNKGVLTIRWDSLRSASKGCPYCTGRYRTTEEIKEILGKINDTYDLLGKYVKFESNIKCKCKICGHIWETSIPSLKTGSGCPKCSMSHGERFIASVLDGLDIGYITQHTFKDCILNQKLKFDFYLPHCNAVIEYDGEQHFKPVDFANKGNDWANKSFIKNIERDKCKDLYCHANNIPLLRIPYWEYDNIETKVIDFIKNIQESQETAG